MKKIALITIGLLLVTSLFSQNKSFSELRKSDKSSEIIDFDVPAKDLHLKIVDGVLYGSIYDDEVLDIVIEKTKKYSVKKSKVVSYIGTVSGDDYAKVEYTVFYSKKDPSKVTHAAYFDADNDFSTYYTIVY